MDSKNKQRNFFLQSFANRLSTTLSDKGYASNTASSGVKVGALSKAANCSNQMARRYTLGEALPDYNTVLNIANWLDISPGWLLFGNDGANTPQSNTDTELVGIDYELLRYILSKIAPLFTLSNDTKEVVDFIMDIIYDAAHLPTNDTMTKKIIDMAISSAGRFQKTMTTDKQKEPPRDTEQISASSS